MFDLVAGDARLTLCPALGGSIGNWQRKGVALLRPTAPEVLHGTSSRALSCFPLIPFSNRIAWGRFSFGARASSSTAISATIRTRSTATPGSAPGTWQARRRRTRNLLSRTTRRPMPAAIGRTATTPGFSTR